MIFDVPPRYAYTGYTGGVIEVSAAAVHLVVVYCRAHHDILLDHDRWDDRFLGSLTYEQVVNVTNASHYLRVKPLIDIMTREIAHAVIGRPAGLLLKLL